MNNSFSNVRCILLIVNEKKRFFACTYNTTQRRYNFKKWIWFSNGQAQRRKKKSLNCSDILFKMKWHDVLLEIVDSMLVMLFQKLLPNKVEVMLHSKFQLDYHPFQVEYQVHKQSSKNKSIKKIIFNRYLLIEFLIEKICLLFSISFHHRVYPHHQS